MNQPSSHCLSHTTHVQVPSTVTAPALRSVDWAMTRWRSFLEWYYKQIKKSPTMMSIAIYIYIYIYIYIHICVCIFKRGSHTLSANHRPPADGAYSAVRDALSKGLGDKPPVQEQHLLALDQAFSLQGLWTANWNVTSPRRRKYCGFPQFPPSSTGCRRRSAPRSVRHWRKHVRKQGASCSLV